MIASIIFTVLLTSFTAVMIYSLFRLQYVHKFRLAIIELCYIWTQNNFETVADNEAEWAFTWCFKELASMEAMIFSVKKLNLETWFSKDIVDKLYSDPETKEFAKYI